MSHAKIGGYNHGSVFKSILLIKISYCEIFNFFKLNISWILDEIKSEDFFLINFIIKNIFL